MIEFWWGGSAEKRKISWVAWKNLCKPKELGGMGFRDIAWFNQALLCKQAWRIWSQPHSLLARVMKGRYFPNGFFLECGIGTRPSYAWRSIMYGRELLVQGLMKRIGDGRSTHVWYDNWILLDVPRPPQGRAWIEAHMPCPLPLSYCSRSLAFVRFSGASGGFLYQLCTTKPPVSPAV